MSLHLFCPEFFLFLFVFFSFLLLCYTPGIFQKAPAWQQLLATLDVAHRVEPRLVAARCCRLALAHVSAGSSPTYQLLEFREKEEPKRRFLCVCLSVRVSARAFPPLVQQHQMHFAPKLKLAFSITLFLLDGFDVCSKGAGLT